MMTGVPISRGLPLSAVLALVAVGALLAGCSGGSSMRSSDVATLMVLTCRDSRGQQGLDSAPARLVNGVDGFVGESQYLPLDAAVVRGQRFLVVKVPLAVAPNARPYRAVSIVRPATARLSYGPRLTRQVRLPSCGDRYSFYPGGVYVRHPACVVLSVTAPNGYHATVAVPAMSRC
ncbi:MAG TPA: hypothetical protein VMA73_22930 [Streptosporangiaceae bacterium]|nr:hypothetical protein [Streptosporangiaceae bacterium]